MCRVARVGGMLVKQRLGKSWEDMARENMIAQTRKLLLMMQVMGDDDIRLREQVGVVRGCSMQFMSWANYLYHGSRAGSDEIMRRFVREVMESKWWAERGSEVAR